MDFNEGIDQLSQMFKNRDWFYDVGTDPYGRYVVYVKYVCHETLYNIPSDIAGKQVLVHFATSKTATREQYTNDTSVVTVTVPVVEVKQTNTSEVLPSQEDEKSLLQLQNELDRLEKICGSYTLQDIFYEIQDGKNAVTNLSSRFPEVRQSMEKLYSQYGFDVIYEELDG